MWSYKSMNNEIGDKMDSTKYILVFPETHKHLGLFQDLSDNSNVKLIVARQKTLKWGIEKLVKRVHLSWTINKHLLLPFKNIWYERIAFNIPREECCIIIIDAALKMLKPGQLNKLFKQKNVRGVLALVNSMDAQSVAILEIKKVIPKIKWDDIYTFDPGDARKYHFKNLGCCYYSMHSPDRILEQYKNTQKSEVYFTGTIKGGREKLIISVFEKLHNASINCNFNIMITGVRRLKKNPYDDVIHYYSGGWIPYEEVLADVFNSDVILEVMQEGQSGPSLRYYEAVCYNKRLLTNNPNIQTFPYYDSRYMKIFRDAEDIDLHWIKEKQKIDYGYRGDFSPQNMLDVVMGGKKDGYRDQ